MLKMNMKEGLKSAFQNHLWFMRNRDLLNTGSVWEEGRGEKGQKKSAEKHKESNFKG